MDWSPGHRPVWIGSVGCHMGWPDSAGTASHRTRHGIVHCPLVPEAGAGDYRQRGHGCSHTTSPGNHPLAKTGDYRIYDRGICRTCVRCTDECAGGHSPFIFTHATLAHFGAHRHTHTSSNADTDRCAINNAPARPNTNAHRAADVRGGPAVATAASTDGRDNSAVAAALVDSHLHCVACSRAHSRPDAPPDTTGDYAGDCSRGNGQRDTQVGC